MSPYFRELVANIERVFPDFAECDLVVEVRIEEAHVIVGSIRGLSVFSTCVVAELPYREVVAEPLKELLQVWLVQCPVLGQVGVVVCQGEERIFLEH